MYTSGLRRARVSIEIIWSIIAYYLLLLILFVLNDFRRLIILYFVVIAMALICISQSSFFFFFEMNNLFPSSVRRVQQHFKSISKRSKRNYTTRVRTTVGLPR